jgi:hypothetical protein
MAGMGYCILCIWYVHVAFWESRDQIEHEQSRAAFCYEFFSMLGFDVESICISFSLLFFLSTFVSSTYQSIILSIVLRGREGGG